jgi:hypothetical protein
LGGDIRKDEDGDEVVIENGLDACFLVEDFGEWLLMEVEGVVLPIEVVLLLFDLLLLEEKARESILLLSFVFIIFVDDVVVVG